MPYLLAQADALRIPLPDQSVDLVFGSPPYTLARLYLEDGKDLGIARGTDDWIAWMLRVTEECLRVSRGAVLWVAAGNTKNRNYQPACEGLVYEWFKRGGSMYRPCYWHRHGISGSGGDQWFRADVEYVMCFKRQGPLPWSDNTAMGHTPKWAAGGAISHRVSDGTRVNQGYVPPALANPGNLIKTNAGGGHMGHPLAHENEAPFPEALAEFFVRSLCPPEGKCLDPFSGSGTTAAVCHRLGRIGLGLDLRRSQCDLGRRRIERTHQAKPKRAKAEKAPAMMEYLKSLGGL